MTFQDKVKKAILEASDTSSFYIGCDSSVTRTTRKDKNGKPLRDKYGAVLTEKHAKYVLVFIVHMDSSKGASIIYEEYKLPEFGNLKQRLLNEANFAIGLGMEIIDLVGKRPLEIHLDINPNPKHKSNVAVKEALAYAKGVGLNAKVKPDSFAAAHAADHFT